MPTHIHTKKFGTIPQTDQLAASLITGAQATICFDKIHTFSGYKDFPGGSGGKVSAYNAGDLGSIPVLGRSSGEGKATHSSTLAWKIPWMEEPGKLQSMGSQGVGHY